MGSEMCIRDRVKAINNGKEFFIPEDKVEEELKPLDQKLFESLRKKFKI